MERRVANPPPSWLPLTTRDLRPRSEVSKSPLQSAWTRKTLVPWVVSQDKAIIRLEPSLSFPVALSGQRPAPGDQSLAQLLIRKRSSDPIPDISDTTSLKIALLTLTCVLVPHCA